MATQPKYMRHQDSVSASPEQDQMGVSLLTKTWKHTDPSPHGIREFRIQGTSNALSIECFGTGPLVPVSFPEVRASSIFAANPGSREAMSFFAEYDFGHMVSRFQGNVNLGLLVVAGFHDFKDAGAHFNYFSREFFYSAESEPAELTTSSAPSPVVNTRRMDTSALLGLWRNTNKASSGVTTVEITERGEGVGIHAYASGKSGPLDWGKVPGSVYAKDCYSSDAMAFRAAFALPGIRYHFQANVKQGVLVIAYFTEFADGSGRSNYFSREFYYKEK